VAATSGTYVITITNAYTTFYSVDVTATFEVVKKPRRSSGVTADV
jgi:hypothetical protein